VASPHEISIPLHCRGIPGALAVKLLSRALKRTELTRYVTNVQIGKQLQQRRRACGPVISAVARAPQGSVSMPTEKHIDDRDRRITTARSMMMKAANQRCTTYLLRLTQHTQRSLCQRTIREQNNLAEDFKNSKSKNFILYFGPLH